MAAGRRKRRGVLRAGTSGWSYPHWRGVLYPAGAKAGEYLRYHARVFSTAEINTSFYRAPGEAAFRRWAEMTPEGYVFSVKAHRSITHEKRLEGVETEWRSFVSAAQALGAKLGPLLLQFPPSFRCRADLLAGFLEAHWRDFGEGLRLAFEFRHASWLGGEAAALLRAHGAALVAGVLGSAELRARWEAELGQMRERIHALRAGLVEKLAAGTLFLGCRRPAEGDAERQVDRRGGRLLGRGAQPPAERDTHSP